MTTARAQRKHHLRAAAAVLGMACAFNAHADFNCRVTVQGVLPYSSGPVNVLHTGRNDWTMVCSLSEPYTNGLTVTPATCMAWVAILLRAKKNNQQVDFWFPGTGTCATIATYGNAPVPTYIGEAS
jgi:hypothetical protein